MLARLKPLTRLYRAVQPGPAHAPHAIQDCIRTSQVPFIGVGPKALQRVVSAACLRLSSEIFDSLVTKSGRVRLWVLMHDCAGATSCRACYAGSIASSPGVAWMLDVVESGTGHNSLAVLSIQTSTLLEAMRATKACVHVRLPLIA